MWLPVRRRLCQAKLSQLFGDFLTGRSVSSSNRTRNHNDSLATVETNQSSPGAMIEHDLTMTIWC